MMVGRTLLVGSLFASLAVTAGAKTDPHDWLRTGLPGADLPVVGEHTYKMSGRVRALLLWMGRDDVGSGVIRWRANEHDQAYELLIGSDPLRAPGKLNKWGFLAEEIRSGECTVVGVMSKDSENRLSDVKAGLSSAADQRPYDTLRGYITEHHAYARVATLQVSTGVTYREADALLHRTLGDRSSNVKQIDRPTNARPGFLSSMAEILRSSVALAKRGSRIPTQSVPYVYGDRLYELRLTGTEAIARFERDGRVFQRVIRGRFETGRPDDRPGSRFEVIFGTEGPLAEIPIVITYQPKWWLHVELTIQT
jgi:hypothetical protein